jgi:hypothetical protein
MRERESTREKKGKKITALKKTKYQKREKNKNKKGS